MFLMENHISQVLINCACSSSAMVLTAVCASVCLWVTQHMSAHLLFVVGIEHSCVYSLDLKCLAGTLIEASQYTGPLLKICAVCVHAQ